MFADVAVWQLFEGLWFKKTQNLICIMLNLQILGALNTQKYKSSMQFI